MTFQGLAAAVVERVAPEAPEGLEVREQPPGFLQAWIDEGRWEAYPLDEPEVEEEIDPAVYDPPHPAFAVLEALDFLQDFVRDELTGDWEAGEPWAEQDEEEIRFGYADGTTFAPIPLDSLNR